jgi:hypothetical protein
LNQGSWIYSQKLRPLDHRGGHITIHYSSFSDIDTDELDSDTKNVEEEVVEFFIKEEITVID